MEKGLIFEIGTEEVPARFIKEYAGDLKNKILTFIVSNNLSRTENCELYYTPRRVIFIKDDVMTKQEDEVKEVFGPPVRVCFSTDGKPQKAFFSFLQKYSISESDCYRAKSEKGEVVAAKIKIEGRSAIDLLKTALPEILRSIKFKKSMRWADLDISFIRPVRWIVAMLGDDRIQFEFAGISSGIRSYGNFNVDNEGFEIKDKSDFLTELESRFVMYNPQKRKAFILSEIQKIIQEYSADEVIDESLLDEVVNILEYPVLIKGSFDERFLSLPPELLEVVQKHHQRYFPVKKGSSVLPVFIAFANNPIGDKDIIRKGMEKVINARFNDAIFFYNEDLKKGVDVMAQSLAMVLYQRDLGDYKRKTERIIKISKYIANCLSIDDIRQREIEITSNLVKADLVSLSVGEFPELQGIMGKYFARNARYDEDICQAIEDHYKPILSGGAIPSNIYGQIIAIADKIDHLTGLFIINQKPSASSDPFGARRAATGIIDIIKECRFKDISLYELVKKTIEGFDIEQIKRQNNKLEINKNAYSEVIEFIRQRIKAQLMEEIKADVAEAILNSESGIDDISSIFERKDALGKVLGKFINGSDFEKFAVVYKRASNITKDFDFLEVKDSLFEYDEEKALFEAIVRIRDKYSSYLVKRDYFNAMTLIKENLYNPIFNFFDKVFVMVDDKRMRENRLALLKNIVILFRKVIDLSYISSVKM